MHPRASKRALRGDDRASGTITSFIVAVALFVVAFSLVTVYFAGFVQQGQSSADVDLDVAADNALSVLTDSPGSPADWDERPGTPDRLGLKEDGSSATMDLGKIRSLQNGTGQVLYDDAKPSLGLRGMDFHIRTAPTFQISEGNADELAGYRVSYLADYNPSTGAPNAQATTESASLEGLEVVFNDTEASDDLGLQNPGDEVPDTERDVAAHLVTRLAGFPYNEDDLIGSLTGDTHWNIVWSPGLTHASTRLDDRFEFVASASDVDGNKWVYTEGSRDRLLAGPIDLTAYEPGDPVWLNMTHAIRGTESVPFQDGGKVQVRDVDESTWTDVTGIMTNEGNRQNFVDGSWRIDAQAGDEIYVGLLWDTTSLSPAANGRGWWVGNLTVEGRHDAAPGARYDNQIDFNTTRYDALVVGSQVDQTVLDGYGTNSTKALEHWVNAGGDVLALGGSGLDGTWLAPFTTGGTGTANGPLLTDESDLSHPVLTTPRTLNHFKWSASDLSYSVDAGDPFTRILLREAGSSEEPLLSTSNPEPGRDGSLLLTSWLPHTFSEDDRHDALENALLYLRYRELYLDYGAAAPTGAPIGSASTTTLVDATDVGLTHLNFDVILYVWKS